MYRLTKAILNRPVTVIVTLLGLVLFGYMSVTSMDLKLMPEMSMPYMIVSTTYTGASPEEVDELAIEKLRSAVSTVSGLDKTQSISNENYGYVMMQFEYGTDMSKAYDDVRTQVDAIKSDLPEDCTDPTIMEIDMNSMEDMTISVFAESPDVDVLNLVEDDIKPQLNRASALAEVTVNGGDSKYIRVQLDPQYCNQYGISTASVVAAIQSVNYSMPAGSVSYGNQKLNMETEVRYEDIPALEVIPITTSGGQTIHLSDVADISYAISDKETYSRYNSTDNVSISLKRKQSETSVTLSRQVKSIIESLQKEYPKLRIEISYDAADEIMSTVRSVFTTLIEGVALSMLVIFIFFGDLKGSLIVGCTMPISLLAAVICMKLMGISLNIVSMNGMVLSIGMITDNAVVVIEQCFRRRAEEKLSFIESAYKGTKLVANSVVGSTLTTVVVYIPLSLMNGLSGQLFKEMGFTFIFILTASLLSAVLLVPFFYSIYRPEEKENNPVTRFINWVGEKYTHVLAKILDKKLIVCIVTAVMIVGTVLLATTLKTELMGSTDEGVINVSMKFRPNTSLDTMDQTVRELEAFAAADEKIEKYNVTITESSASAALTAYKADDCDYTTQEIVDMWNEELQDFSMACEISASAGSTTGMSQMSSAASEEVDIIAYDLDSLKEASKQVMAVMEDTEGVLSVSSTVSDTGTKVDVDIDPEMARAKGFSAQQLSGLVYQNMKGTKAIDVTLDGKNYDIKVEYPKDYYKTLNDVQSMTFTNAMGVSVPITEMAEVKFASSPQTVQRLNGDFTCSVTATMTSESKDAVMEVLQPKLDAIQFKDGVSYAPNTITEMMNDEFKAIGQSIVVGIYLVFMVMAIQFESVAYSVLVMFCVPFALIGSVAALAAMQIKVSMVALMGVLMLAGIVVNNGIIYIDQANQFRDAGEEVKHALIHAGKDRLRPILMTTLTTELSMMPVALGLAKNSEIMQGMAVVIVGGLFASTLLTLLLLPTFYLIIERFKKPRKEGKLKTESQRLEELIARLEEKDREYRHEEKYAHRMQEPDPEEDHESHDSDYDSGQSDSSVEVVDFEDLSKD